MQYTLITAKGNKMTFFIRAVAELYKSINGGSIIEVEISVDNQPKLAV